MAISCCFERNPEKIKDYDMNSRTMKKPGANMPRGKH
jgi:hypothetical protein